MTPYSISDHTYSISYSIFRILLRLSEASTPESATPATSTTTVSKLAFCATKSAEYKHDQADQEDKSEAAAANDRAS